MTIFRDGFSIGVSRYWCCMRASSKKPEVNDKILNTNYSLSLM